MSPEKMPVGGGGGLGRAAYSASNSRCRSFIISNSSGVNVRAGLFGGETGPAPLAALSGGHGNPGISKQGPKQDKRPAAAARGAGPASQVRLLPHRTKAL